MKGEEAMRKLMKKEMRRRWKKAAVEKKSLREVVWICGGKEEEEKKDEYPQLFGEREERKEEDEERKERELRLNEEGRRKNAEDKRRCMVCGKRYYSHTGRMQGNGRRKKMEERILTRIGREVNDYDLARRRMDEERKSSAESAQSP